MSSQLVRQRVLACYKSLQKTRKIVFADDKVALSAGRIKINEEFKKHKEESNPERIEELIRIGYEAEEYLSTSVIQAKHNPEKDVYELRLRPEVTRLDNKMYDDSFEPLPPKGKRIKKNT